MNVRIAVAAAVLCLFSAGEAWADDWRVVSASREQFLAVDVATIQNSGGRTYYWSLNLFRVTQPDGVEYYMMRTAIDCTNRTIELSAEIDYNAAHEVVASHEPTEGPFSIPPSSVGATMYNALCGGQWEGSTRFSTVRDMVSQGRPALERMPVR